jgi:hypothetical protein
VTERGETSEETHKIEPEPLGLPEEIMLPESGEEPVLEETAERGEEEPLPEHDRAAEEITEADEQGDVLVVAHDARESVRSRKKWVYIPGILIIIILLGVAIPLVEDDIIEHFFLTAPAVSKKMDLPSYRDEAMKEVSPGGDEGTTGLTSFREDVFKKLLHE